MPRRCALGCPPKLRGILHRFPDPHKYPKRHAYWIKLVKGESINGFDYKKIRICDRHFTDKHRTRNNRLSIVAVPSLFLPDASLTELEPILDSILTETGPPSPELKSSVHAFNNTYLEHNYAIPFKKQTARLQSSETGPSMTEPSPISFPSSPDPRPLSNPLPDPLLITYPSPNPMPISFPSSPDPRSLSNPLPDPLLIITYPSPNPMPISNPSSPDPMPISNTSSPDPRPSSHPSLPELIRPISNPCMPNPRPICNPLMDPRLISHPSLTGPSPVYGSQRATTNELMVPSKYRKMQKVIKNLRREILRQRKRQQTFKERLKKAENNCSNEEILNQLLEKMTNCAKIFTLMQIKQTPIPEKARRFSFEEKMLSLSLYERSPECYTLMSELFTLPSIKCMKRLMAEVVTNPAMVKII